MKWPANKKQQSNMETTVCALLVSAPETYSFLPIVHSLGTDIFKSFYLANLKWQVENLSKLKNITPKFFIYCDQIKTKDVKKELEKSHQNSTRLKIKKMPQPAGQFTIDIKMQTIANNLLKDFSQVLVWNLESPLIDLNECLRGLKSKTQWHVKSPQNRTLAIAYRFPLTAQKAQKVLPAFFDLTSIRDIIATMSNSGSNSGLFTERLNKLSDLLTAIRQGVP